MIKLPQRLSKIIGKTIFDYKMIEKDDRILAAVSGGKDSLTMLCDLIDRQKRLPFDFYFQAIYLSNDFTESSQKEYIINLLKEFSVSFTVIDLAVTKRVKSGEKMNCYWCSAQRRMELMKYARNNNFNKIALGHHLDDIIETLLMNIFYKGQISGMLPVLSFDKYPLKIIRPLSEVKEETIIKFIDESGIKYYGCSCPYSDNSKRKKTREALKIFTGGNDKIKYNIFKSMQNVKKRYLSEE